MADDAMAAAIWGGLVLVPHNDSVLEDLESLVIRIGGRCRIAADLRKTFSETRCAIAILNAGAERVLLPAATNGDAGEVLDAGRFWTGGESDRMTANIGSDTELVPVVHSTSAVREISGILKSERNVVWSGAADHPGLIEAFWNSLKIDSPDGLVPTLVVDQLGTALGLAWSSRESFTDAVANRRGCYWSRSRQELWIKGRTSGSEQRLVSVGTDCDRDTLRFVVDQGGSGFCHEGSWGCFGEDRSLSEIERHVTARITGDDAQSFSRRLVNDPDKLREKLLEEAGELSAATSREEAIWEMADVLYFALLALRKQGGNLADVRTELARRMHRVERRTEKKLDANGTQTPPGIN